MQMRTLVALGITTTAAFVIASIPVSNASRSGVSASSVVREAPFSMCFAPDTSPEYIKEIQQQLLDQTGGSIEYNLTTRWPGTIGTPVTLTYSFVPDGTETSNGPSVLFQFMNAANFGSDQNGNGKPDWQDLFRQMFDDWTAVTGNTYIETTDDGAPWPESQGAPGVRGDLRIACAPIDGPGNTWAFNYYPGQTAAGDMLIDSVDVTAISLSTNNYRRFRNLVGHEHGHGQGLFHVCPDSTQSGGATKLMEPYIVSDFDGPQLDDVLGAQSLYGDRFEPNNSVAGATALESLGLESNVMLSVRELSLHAISDGDLFSFHAQGGSTAHLIAVGPEGTAYLEGDQIGGVCEAGVAFDALRQADLQVELVDPNGNTIASANSTGAGAIEQFDGVTLPTTGIYIIRVRAAAFDGTQLYRLAVRVSISGVPGDLTGNGVVDGVDLAILLSLWNVTGPDIAADLNGDGVVNGADLAWLLALWTSN